MTLPTCTGYEILYQAPFPPAIQDKLINYVVTCQHHKVARIMRRHLITYLWCRLNNQSLYVAKREAGSQTEIKIYTAATKSFQRVALFREFPWQPHIDRFRNNLF